MVCLTHKISDRLSNSDSWIKRDPEKQIRATPSQYRALTSDGVQAKFHVIVGAPKGEHVVDFQVLEHGATISDPVQTRTRLWEVNVQFDKITFILPGSTEAVDFVAAGAAGAATAPSPGYSGRVAVRLKANIAMAEGFPGNLEAVVEVQTVADGTIVGRKLLRSSGNGRWDDTVLKAIDRTEVLPRDTDGRVPPVLTISITPQ